MMNGAIRNLPPKPRKRRDSTNEMGMPGIGIQELIIIGAICAVPVLMGLMAIVIIMAAIRKK